MVERRQSLHIDVPGPSRDTPRIARVGVIAGVAFAIGILWPRFAGFSLVPPAPVDESAEAEAQLEPAKPAKVISDERPSQKRLPADRIKIGEAQITSCRTEAGRRKTDCGLLDFDPLARPRIHALAGCDAAEGAMGVLSIGLDVDFEKNRVTEITSGKSTDLPEPTTAALLRCTRRQFEGATLEGIEHEHPRYTVYYLVDLLPPVAEKEGLGDVVPASGRATVGWRVALIRSQPKDGEVLANILSGARVVVTGRQGDWYRVKYDAKGNEGWVYKGAIGLDEDE